MYFLDSMKKKKV